MARKAVGVEVGEDREETTRTATLTRSIDILNTLDKKLDKKPDYKTNENSKKRGKVEEAEVVVIEKRKKLAVYNMENKAEGVEVVEEEGEALTPATLRRTTSCTPKMSTPVSVLKGNTGSRLKPRNLQYTMKHTKSEKIKKNKKWQGFFL